MKISLKTETQVKVKKCLNCGKELKTNDIGYDISVCGICHLDLLEKLMSRPEKHLKNSQKLFDST